MENLNGIAIFVHAAQTQSFVETARVMGISPSAVSKSISRLEQRVSVRLFQRSTRSIRLTAEGQTFLERCQRILQELGRAESELASMSGAPRGRLRIGLAFAAGLTLPMLSAFAERYPDIELDMNFSDELSDVIDEGLDVVIRGGDAKDSRLKSRRLGSSRIILIASPAYIKKNGKPTRPAALTEHACLRYRNSSSGRLAEWPLKRSTTPAPFHLPASMVSNSLDALIQMTKDGRGIACVPEFAASQLMATGQLVSVLDAHMTQTITFRLLWPSSKHLTPKVRAFVDFAAAQISHFLS